MSDLSDAYLASHYAANRITTHRQNDQRRIFGLVEAHAGKPLEELLARDLQSYVETALSAGLAPTTVEKQRRYVTPFIEWMWKRELIDAERYMRFKGLRAPRGAHDHEPRPYSPAERRTLWLAVEQRWPWCLSGDRSRARAEMFLTRWLNGTSQWKRARPLARRLQVEAIISLGMHAGLRCHEIYGLELEEMHHENEYLVVRSARKNRSGEQKRRLIPWATRDLRVAVKDWLWFRSLAAEEFGIDHDRPWLRLDYGEQTRFQPVAFKTFAKMFEHDNRWGSDLTRAIRFHRLRHTAATEMLRAGMPLEIVQQVMGHSNIEMTLRYAKIAKADLLKAADLASPELSRAMSRPEIDTQTGVLT